jgi:hypothetical protein
MQLKEYLTDWRETLSLGSNDLAKHRYYEFVQHHYQSVLKKMYLRLGVELEIDWEIIADKYFNVYPAESYELNRLTFAFPEFVQQYSLEFNWPEWAFDLAQYELAEFIVYTDAKMIEDSLDLQINPTLLLLEFEYDIASWVIARDRGLSAEIRKSPQILAIVRNPETHLCQFTQVTPDILDILRQIDSQLPISTMNPTIKFMQQQSILI